jgi:hypothetical protein
MAAVLSVMDSLGTWLLYSAGTLLLFLGPVWLTFKIVPELRKPRGGGSFWEPTPWQRRKRAGLQVAVGLLLFALMGTTFYPSLEAIKRHGCKDSRDFEFCMEGE